MKITIGKAEDNSFVIRDPEVSRYHAALTREDNGDLLLEDLDSTNGTFVNDHQIMKKKVSAGDKISLGTNYTLYVSDLLKSDNDYSDEFARLKDVYDNYIRAKIQIQSKNQFKTRLFQSLPFAMVGVFGIMIHFLRKTSNSLLIISFVIAICAPVWESILAPVSQQKFPNCCKDLPINSKLIMSAPNAASFWVRYPGNPCITKNSARFQHAKQNGYALNSITNYELRITNYELRII